MALDEYLKGVVPTEMGLKKPLEALKAQAIAARSYAATTRRHARDGFDMCTTTHCQVWRPKNRYPDSDRAVDETAGKVVTYNGGLVGTPYFGHCDGHTRSSEEVWASPVAYCRSVPCDCGYKELYGHGVGMCQRGAAAMAAQGAPAEAILKHYYTGVEIQAARPVARTSFRRSIVLGQVVDGGGQGRGGLRLTLGGTGGSLEKGTTADGRFWFTGLAAGEWELRVKGKPVRYGDLVTDGRNTLDVQVVVPDAPPLLAHTVPLAYPRLLIGTLGYDGVPVSIGGASGDEVTVLSGTAPDYNPGGFAVPLPPGGTCTIEFLGQRFGLAIDDMGMWVRFVPEPA
jgi:hypothetical protein